MLQEYKAMISDEEVIRALIKESKQREGKLPTESTRIKPNLNFFQRTVSSLISNNKRIDTKVDKCKTKNIQACKTYTPNNCCNKSIDLCSKQQPNANKIREWDLGKINPLQCDFAKPESTKIDFDFKKTECKCQQTESHNDKIHNNGVKSVNKCCRETSDDIISISSEEDAVIYVHTKKQKKKGKKKHRYDDSDSETPRKKRNKKKKR